MDIGRDHQITIQTSKEVSDKLRKLIPALDIQFFGRPLKSKYFYNAILLWLANAPESEIREFIDPKLHDLAERIAGNDKPDNPGRFNFFGPN